MSQDLATPPLVASECNKAWKEFTDTATKLWKEAGGDADEKSSSEDAKTDSVDTDAGKESGSAPASPSDETSVCQPPGSREAPGKD